jgi:hypothetical protein
MAGQLTVDTLRASSGVLATQNGMTGIPKAWVQFTGGTTPSINGSFNVSSITYNSTGDYTITFTTAMANTNYAVAGGANINTSNTGFLFLCPFAGSSSPYSFAPTTSSFRLLMTWNGGVAGALDPVRGSVIVLGN